MAAKCPACNKNCTNAYALSCNKCGKWYHTDCVNITKSKLSYFERELKNPGGVRWFCLTCDNKNEVRCQQDKTPNAGKQRPTSVSTDQKTYYTLKDVMDKLFTMEKNQSELLNKYEIQLQINEDLKMEINKLKCRLDSEINKNEQKELENNIVVSGIPQNNKQEALQNIVETVLDALEVNVEVPKCYRIGKSGSMAPPIKICFKNKEDKDKLMVVVKKKKITLASLGLENDDTQVYFNHDMTKRNQLLFMHTRKFKRENNYKYVWFTSGSIFLKKDDDSKVEKIISEEDLKN